MTKDTNESEWLKTIYEVTWNQYAHEDELRHHKNVLYISIQTALFAFIPASIGFIDGIEDIKNGEVIIDVSWLVISIFVFLTSVIALRVLVYWANVVRSGRAWLYMRLANALRIEYQVKIQDFGLGSIEDSWEEFCNENPDVLNYPDEKSYHPFQQIDELSHVTMYPKQKMGESRAALGIVSTLRMIWLVIMCFSLAYVIYRTYDIYRMLV